MADLTVSVVLYKTPWDQFAPLVDTILACPRVRALWLVDHSPRPVAEAGGADPRIVRIRDPRNPGYGAGHNRALADSVGEGGYHAVINPDIRMSPDLLGQLADYLDRHPEVACVTPTILGPDGTVANQGRMLPSPWDLVGRRWFDGLWRRRKRRYEVSLGEKPLNVPNLSGAFLFLRCSALEEVGLFDERFFLYCEDVDLVRRLHERYRTEALPHLQVVHGHRRDSYHDWRLTLVHSVSAFRYFQKWGWWDDRGRREFNARAARP